VKSAFSTFGAVAAFAFDAEVFVVDAAFDVVEFAFADELLFAVNCESELHPSPIARTADKEAIDKKKLSRFI